MSGAIALLIVNSAVAGLFSLCYFLIALINRSERPVIVFSISYLIGMSSPISELMVHFSNYPVPFMLLSYFGLECGFLAMAAALSAFERKRPLWPAIFGIACLAAIMRFLIWNGPRDDLLYEICYQLPLALALFLCVGVALSNAHRLTLYYTLSVLFGACGANFLIKPFVAVAMGSGRTAKDYAGSAYALYSQASNGILLTAAGLVVLLVVIQTAIREHLETSDTDHLSGLLNRRGFDRRAQGLVGSTLPEATDVCVVMIDLDHFKSINDTWGHDTGDRVIQIFSEILRNAAPQSALAARTGGEEFVLLLHRTKIESARLLAELIRQQTTAHQYPDIPAFTFSAGIAKLIPGESLSQLIRRADQATYRAKLGGRNRSELDLTGIADSDDHAQDWNACSWHG
ncbi:diguanylate cyclase [Novosphingobium sp. Rr 2-17]|uniref:GGDEF domain-containing protein n=1 Tax=Novosphingobium sp. Rr 2-17 TaxID=555793 RepID=UPI000269A49A|nr:diguanylate cyclase [Novosphingobium sp. Rr 2-17]EIZ80893.1 diguanylate cyclase [Novosphingobium sp. Rr 2-17]